MEKVSKSTKRFNKNLAKLDDQRNRLLEEGKFSLASGMGKLVIIASKSVDYESNYSPDKQVELFIEEGEQLQEQLRPYHADVVLRKSALYDDIISHVHDKEVSDMIFIGHGSIGAFWLEGDTKLGWQDLAHENKESLMGTDRHLKLGQIVQRVCGNFPVRSVPLGTPVVADLMNVIAPLGKAIPDAHPDESLFRPVYTHNGDMVSQVHAMNERFSDQNDRK